MAMTSGEIAPRRATRTGGRARLAGAAEAVARIPEPTALGLQVDAVMRACAAAGIPVRMIDGIAVSVSADLRPAAMPSLELANALGVSPTFIDNTLCGGSAPVVQIARAAAAIEQGLCNVAVVAYASVQASSRQRRKAGWQSSSALLTDDVVNATGWRNPISVHAMIAARHMYEFGTTSEQLASVAVSQRSWAMLNPAAHKRDPLTVEEVLASPMISTPLHVLDCCLITDGGGAVVLCRRDLLPADRPEVLVRAIDEIHTHQNILTLGSLTTSGAKRTGLRALQQAGLTVADIDQVQLYDAFTDMPIVLLEDLGFCAKGDGGPFVSEGRTRPGGDLPMNTQGGGLSHCHPGMYGIFLVIEALQQLQGEAGLRQQPDVEHVLCHGVGGGAFGSHATLILGRADG
jgi:acetyl-CoA acetyltransferase